MPARSVRIYGKDTCGYTTRARVEYTKRGYAVEYLNLKKDAAAMARFLELSGGDRRVPLIEEDGRVTVGYDGT
jgi:glutaredoxin